MRREPTPSPREPVFLSEDAAHRLLARAVELDAQRASQVSVAQLREIAREAGIAPEAFDQALTEFRGLSARADEAEKPGLVGSFRHWWRSAGTAGSDTKRPGSTWRDVKINVLAFAGFWVVLSAFSRTSSWLGLDWPANHAGAIVANLIGLGLALRLRGRVTAVILGVTAAAQLAEYVMNVLFGIHTVQGGPTKWALLLAGLLGIGVGALVSRSRGRSAPSVPDAEVEPVITTAEPSGAPHDPPPVGLRLRTA